MVPKIKLDNDYSVLQVNDILLPLWQCQKNEGQPQASADPVSKLTTTNMNIAKARCETQLAVRSSGLNAC